MTLRRERVPAGAAALLAVLLAMPSVLAPTWRLTTLDSQGGVVLFEQQLWSWGRSQVLGAGGAVVQDLWDPVGLVVLVALLVLAAAAVVAWLLVRAAWVPVVAPLPWAALLGHLVTSAAQRHGRPVRDDVHGLAASGASTIAGWLESASVVVLAAAIVLMVLRLVAEGRPEQPAEAEPSQPDGDEAPAPRPAGRSTRASLRPDGAHLAGPEVGLSDDR